MKMTMKNAAFPLVAGVILAVTGTIGATTIADQNAMLEADKSKLGSLTQKVEAARSSSGQLQSSISVEASGGRAERVATDTELIEELLDRALTWDSNAAYTEARESTMRLYGLSENSAFMASFLPEAPVNLDKQGNEYPYIDAAGLNSQLRAFKVKLLSVDTIDYSYMVLVDVQARSSDGLGTAVNVATVFVTVDGEGTLSNISGFASTTSPRSSG